MMVARLGAAQNLRVFSVTTAPHEGRVTHDE